MTREAISEVSCRIRRHIAVGNIAVAQFDRDRRKIRRVPRVVTAATDSAPPLMRLQKPLFFRLEMLFRCCTWNNHRS
jgi:hypothetical protein